MPKKKHTLTPLTKVNKSTISFDGDGRDYKDAIRLLINDDLWEQSQLEPIRMFSLLGAKCSDYKLFKRLKMKIKTCVSVEIFKKEYLLQKKTISGLSPQDRKAVYAHHSDVRDFFSKTPKSNKEKEVFNEGFDLFFLDYIGCYNKEMIKDIETLATNEEMLHYVIDKTGAIFLYLTTSSRYQKSEDFGRLENIEEKYSHLSPKIDDTAHDDKDQEAINKDHWQSYGIHYSVSNIFKKAGLRCEQTHCLYYKDGNKGTRMLLSGWKLTKISDKELETTVIEPLKPLKPVYLGFRNSKAHKRSIQWAASLRERNVINFREDEFALLADNHKKLQTQKPEASKRVSKAVRMLSNNNNGLVDIINHAPGKVYPNPMAQETRIALLENGIIKKPKANGREDWGKMAAAMTACLKAHKRPVTQKTLVGAVLARFPEYRQLQTSQAGKLNQSKLTNAMAWAKAALKKGGYTTNKKDCLAGEILMLTQKGLISNLNRESVNSWSEYYTLIKTGKL